MAGAEAEAEGFKAVGFSFLEGGELGDGFVGAVDSILFEAGFLGKLHACALENAAHDWGEGVSGVELK